MRKKVIAGNWKMYKTIPEALKLTEELKTALRKIITTAEVVVCPTALSIPMVRPLLQDTAIRLGAQNMHAESEGAFTGEISGPMLVAAGCTHVILGHSERRHYFGETDAQINAKARKALSLGLTPIVCVGETLEQREQGITDAVVSGQVKGVLAELSPEQVSQCIIAYEPVWAIGTGKTATPAQAQEVHSMIRMLVKKMAGEKVASGLVVQYGGSVKPENAKELLSQLDIDGALVGGACLKADSFAAIIAAA